MDPSLSGTVAGLLHYVEKCGRMFLLILENERKLSKNYPNFESKARIFGAYRSQAERFDSPRLHFSKMLEIPCKVAYLLGFQAFFYVINTSLFCTKKAIFLKKLSKNYPKIIQGVPQSFCWIQLAFLQMLFYIPCP